MGNDFTDLNGIRTIRTTPLTINSNDLNWSLSFSDIMQIAGSYHDGVAAYVQASPLLNAASKSVSPIYFDYFGRGLLAVGVTVSYLQEGSYGAAKNAAVGYASLEAASLGAGIGAPFGPAGSAVGAIVLGFGTAYYGDRFVDNTTSILSKINWDYQLSGNFEQRFNVNFNDIREASQKRNALQGDAGSEFQSALQNNVSDFIGAKFSYFLNRSIDAWDLTQRTLGTYALPTGASTFDLYGRPVFNQSTDESVSFAERDSSGSIPAASGGAAAEGLGYGMASPVMPYSPPSPGGTGTASVGGSTASGTLDNNLGLPIPEYDPVVPSFTPAPQGDYTFQPQTGGVDPYEYGGYGGGTFFMDMEWGSSEPLILDLDGNGVRIDTLQTSRTYFDMSGNGGRNRTAWAAGGDGVLAIDANGDGKINQRSEVVFTDWTEMAGNDMQAVKMVFDTNNDGMLSNADTRWGDFKVVKDGAVYALAQLGITQIGLNGDAMTADLPDGSQIQTSSAFIMNGVARTVSAVRLSYDEQNGRAVTGGGAQTVV